jgi:hypothetical protein
VKWTNLAAITRGRPDNDDNAGCLHAVHKTASGKINLLFECCSRCLHLYSTLSKAAAGKTNPSFDYGDCIELFAGAV